MKRLSFLLATLVACGGTPEKTTTPTGGGTGGSGGGKPAAAGDVSFDVTGIEVKGMVFEPEALGRPGMPLVEAKKKVTIDKQRTVFANTKDPVQKEAQAAILATLLYQQSKVDKTKEKELWIEARQALRDAAKISGDKVDEITLRLLGSYELLLEDYAAAETAWAALVNADPKNKEALYSRAWWAFALLKQFKNPAALDVVKNEALSDKQPELAYVTAWAKWRASDDAGAWTAIVTAANGWGNMAGREALDRDVYLFAGRSNVSLAETTPAMFKVFNAKQKAQQYEVLAKLGLQSYGFAGRWADGVAALDQAVALAGASVPVNDLPVLRYSQADFTVRLDAPEVAAKYGKQAIEAMPACGAKCSEKEKQDLIGALQGMGLLFHVLYATANDLRYYQPAHDLYTATISLIMDGTKRAEAQKNLATLEATVKNTKAGTGTHDKGAIGALVNRHNQEVQACYEAQLAANPKLGGNLTLNLESDNTGAVKGVATEPKAGLADLSAVAGCVAEHAKGWKLPKRGMAGNTRIKVVYALSPRK
ncbi:MAG: AgmX/PglI C-terminal domain-containing protein [Deltaproteobacteria bacterium]|nr:AgmX/PglI C-terminal domain-containing protein [Deltaproteobacteria bacterium]